MREADLAHDVRRDDRGQDAQTHLREREDRLASRRSRCPHTATRPAAAAHRRALHAREQRHRQLVERAEQLRERARVGHVLGEREIGHAAHPVEVRAGAERVALAAQHDGARGRVDAAEDRAQLRDELRVERVAHVGARERDPGDAAAVDLAADNVGHGRDDSESDGGVWGGF